MMGVSNGPVSFQRTETILDRILERKTLELAKQQQQQPLAHIRSAAENSDLPRPFEQTLRSGKNIAIIAECKRKSPSAGTLHPDFDPLHLASHYERGGVAAISVLTDSEFFGGSLADLQAVKANTALPILRKDFLFDPYQLFEARASGADAVLLIVAALEEDHLKDLLTLSRELSLAALVEVHDETELQSAQKVGATLIGINNRDLRNFQTDLTTTIRLAPLASPATTLVAESGIRNAEDVMIMAKAGADAILVGEALMRASDLPKKLAELTSVSRS